ncbi:MAG: hypothetical protein VKJ06_09425 [Vampirovibrionales bacterium]|nr:hypothetical protein [Vampirovibrionales bacterium]
MRVYQKLNGEFEQFIEAFVRFALSCEFFLHRQFLGFQLGDVFFVAGYNAGVGSVNDALQQDSGFLLNLSDAALD